MTVPVSDTSNTIQLSDFEQRVARDARTRSTSLYRNFLKRALDVALVAASSIVVVPLVLLLALIVRSGGGAAFYTQTRIGRGGRKFVIYKLRTMVHDADLLLDDHLEASQDARAEWLATQKLKYDPRITPFGRFLRKTSMDELPQLVNVLRGDMSLVGPRPIMEGQVVLYPGSAYYRLRPGITGFWQVSDRNQCDFADRAHFDEAYDRSLSFSTDLRVLAQTVAVVFRGTGY
jgi:lipopolysaccharide/colanic/teichoic acid biosynthesis glycosyltransferase